MLKFKSTVLAISLALGAYASASQADDYFSTVSDKFTKGFVNLFTGIGEVPKNIAYVSDKTNPIAGATGGLIMGTLHTLGRTASGVFDVITSPIPIESMVEPGYVWEDFKKPTSYGGTFK
jgi:putative exosortase-associated protein (TIGR04073 family)